MLVSFADFKEMVYTETICTLKNSDLLGIIVIYLRLLFVNYCNVRVLSLLIMGQFSKYEMYQLICVVGKQRDILCNSSGDQKSL